MTDLKKLMSYPLSDIQVKRYAKKMGLDCKVVTYDKIHKYKTLDQLLGKNKCVVILYLSEPHFGHYVTVFKRGNTIEFFDPYGISLDNEFSFIPNKFKKESNQDYPYLTQLIYNSGYKVRYNQYRLQKGDNNINCCGRHALVRLCFRHLNEDQYSKMLRKIQKSPGYTPDEFVCLMTRDIRMTK